MCKWELRVKKNTLVNTIWQLVYDCMQINAEFEMHNVRTNVWHAKIQTRNYKINFTDMKNGAILKRYFCHCVWITSAVDYNNMNMRHGKVKCFLPIASNINFEFSIIFACMSYQPLASVLTIFLTECFTWNFEYFWLNRFIWNISPSQLLLLCHRNYVLCSNFSCVCL